MEQFEAHGLTTYRKILELGSYEWARGDTNTPLKEVESGDTSLVPALSFRNCGILALSSLRLDYLVC